MAFRRENVAALLALLAAGCSKAGAEDVATSTDNLGEGDGIVISQVYGGTGAPGAVWNRDYVELFNRSGAPVSLARLSIHIGGGAAALAPAIELPANAVVPAGGYYLVGFGGGGEGADLKVDAGGAGVSILPINGKVALVRTGASGFVDLLGYGDAAQREGLAAPRGARGKAMIRKNAGCTDTDNNNADFEAGVPKPRSSKSVAHVCGAT